MKNLKISPFILLFSLFLFSCNSPAENASFEEGKHYTKLKTAQPDGGEQIEVLEFFWYGCPHCYTLEPHIKKWLKTKPKNVKFTRVPAVFRPDWKVQAAAYYALETMGEVDKAHEALFDAIHKKKQRYSKIEDIAGIVASTGVDKDKFLQATRSFSVQVKVKQAAKILQAYRISGVPTVAVNGQYTTGARQAGSNQKVAAVLDYLLEKEAERLGRTLN